MTTQTSENLKSILVTGGAGFIGSNFILETLKTRPGYKVINLDALTYAGNLENLKEVENDSRYVFVRGDIKDEALVSGLFERHDIQRVVHFAAESHVDRSIEDPSIFLRTNILGTFSLLQCARSYWQASGKSKEGLFVHVSTDEVYGSLGSEGLFTEETAYKPNSPYSASKASSDHLVRSYFHTYNLPVVITNCSNNYGPYQFPEKLIPLIINNILHKQPLPVYGEGKNVRDWLYVSDHCRAILKVMEAGRLGEQYNIGGFNEWTNIDIVKLVCKLMDNKLGRSGAEASQNLITFVKDRPGHDLRYAIDSTKIKNELGWQPQESFETGIAKTIDWYLSQKTWLENVTCGGYQNYYKEMYGNR